MGMGGVGGGDSKEKGPNCDSILSHLPTEQSPEFAVSGKKCFYTGMKMKYQEAFIFYCVCYSFSVS